MKASPSRHAPLDQRASTLDELRKVLRVQLPSLRERYGVESMMIFGSCARGEQRRRSDLDILVELDENRPLTLLQFIALENELSFLTGRKVDLVERAALKPAIGRRILAEAIPL